MLGKWPLLAGLCSVLIPGLVASGQDGKVATSPSRAERLLALHTENAASYAIFRDAARTQKLELKREPIYRWSNPIRNSGQEGDVFVWTYRGRPEVIASIFSHPTDDRKERVLCHELLSLSEAVLVVDRDSPNRWEPKAPGIEPRPVPGAPTPASTPAQRATQGRALAREFSGRSLSEAGEAWELRLLPKPLYRYEGPDVLEGAIYALVSTAGTDPEILLLLEARKTPEGPKWLYAGARFSDMNLWLKHKNQEVWSSIRDGENTFEHDALHRYRFYPDLTVPEIESGAPSGEAKKTEAK